MAVTVTVISLRNVTPCSLVDVYWRVGNISICNIDGWILNSGQTDRCMQLANRIPKGEQETSEQTGQTLYLPLGLTVARCRY
jgi:hypothetical protein